MKYLFAIGMSFVLAACGTQPASQEQVDTAVAAIFTENVPLATETPASTETQQPTNTPSFAAFTAQQAIDAFEAAGLATGAYYPMTKDDYGIGPYVGVGIRFLIPSLGVDKGGRVVAFDNEEDMELLRSYYEELGRQSALFFSWVYVHQNVLLQINGDLPEDQALQYKVALDTMGQ